MRPIISMAVAAQLDDEAVQEAARAIEAVGEQMASRIRPGKRPRSIPNRSEPAQDFFPTSPIMGLENPIAPPIRVRVVHGEDGRFSRLVGEANFDYQYEGPPTCVHGGIIAETFDEVLGAATIASGNPGMTGTLTIRYRRPTPLRTDLRIEAHLTGRSGRKIKAWAGLYDGDQLTAEAEGLFIEVRPTQFVAIAEGNVETADPVMLEAIRAEATRSGAASDVQGAIDESTAIPPEDLPPV
jgi:acyl-coenzyme A thioesterase PaaI-like protein